MKEQKVRPFVRRMRAAAADAANSLHTDLVSFLNDESFTDETERHAAIKFFLEDELLHFYFSTLKLQVADEDGLRKLSRIVARMAGQRSAASRFEKSTKARFLEWAIEAKAKSPHLSKNALAARYAQDHPNTSLSTLRRYLGDGELRKLWGDD